MDAAPPRPARAGVFHGWRIVSVAFVSLAASVGSTIYAYGVFVKPIETEFGASRMVAVLGITILNAAVGLASPLIGRRLDGGSMRAIMAGGALLLGAGLALAGQATSLWQLAVLVASLIAVGSAMTGPLTGSTLVANWFVEKRGRALGVATVGTSFGGFVLTPIAAWLVVSLGWRGALTTAGIFIALAVAPAAWLVVSNRPEDRGLHPDGAAEAIDPASVPDEPNTRGVLRDRRFWLITLVIGLTFGVFNGAMTNLIPFAIDLGNDPARAALLMSSLAGFGVIGKLAFGAMADRVDGRLALWGALTIAAAAVAILSLEPDYSRLLLASSLLGLSTGGLLPVWGVILGACFGRERFGSVMGLMQPFMLPLTLAAAPFAGWVYDTTGSYVPAFRLFVAGFALAALTLALLRVPRSA